MEIVKAVGQLDSFQSSAAELDQLCREEQSKREAIERRMKHIEQNGGASLRQGIIVRESRAQLKKSLQEKVEQLHTAFEDAVQQRKSQEKSRDGSIREEMSSQEALQQVQRQNQEVQASIREAEKMLRKAEGDRLEAMSMYETVSLDYGRCKSQIQVREQLILDLQGRIEDDYERWNVALTAAQVQRRQDQERYVGIEDEKSATLRKLMEERQALALKMKDLLEEARLTDLLRQKDELNTRLTNQRALNVKLGEKKTATEDQIKRLELQCSRHEIQVLQSNQVGLLPWLRFPAFAFLGVRSCVPVIDISPLRREHSGRSSTRRICQSNASTGWRRSWTARCRRTSCAWTSQWNCRRNTRRKWQRCSGESRRWNRAGVLLILQFSGRDYWL